MGSEKKHSKSADKPSLFSWFIVIFTAVFLANVSAFTIEKMIGDREGKLNNLQQATNISSIEVEARKVLQALGGNMPTEAQGAKDSNKQAEEKREQLIAAKAECDVWTQKLTMENSAVNRMSKNRSCQQVSQFMNQIEAGQ